MKYLTAKDLMSPNVFWVRDTTTISQALARFAERKISGAPVINDRGVMIGVVSIHDLIEDQPFKDQSDDDSGSVYYQRIWEKPLNSDTFRELIIHPEKTVVDVMTPAVFSVEEDTPIQKLAETMLLCRIHRLLVTRGETLTGIVTTMDMLKAIRDSG